MAFDCVFCRSFFSFSLLLAASQRLLSNTHPEHNFRCTYSSLSLSLGYLTDPAAAACISTHARCSSKQQQQQHEAAAAAATAADGSYSSRKWQRIAAETANNNNSSSSMKQQQQQHDATAAAA
ncbi:hypothetical protein Emed_004878 [Eimeria media]